MKDETRSIFATLEEPVTLASSSAAMLTTKEAGRVVGFGCTEIGRNEAGVVIGAGTDGDRPTKREA
jgi:hypothetical protein